MPNRVMLDADAHSFLKEDIDLLLSVSESDVVLHLSEKQAGEIEAGLAELPQSRREGIMAKIQLVEDLAGPILTDIDTVGYGDVYGSAYAGTTGEIFEELMEPHPNIRQVHRPDAIGAEAAINRDMPFVTNDGALKDKMRDCGYGDYLQTWDDFRELFDN